MKAVTDETEKAEAKAAYMAAHPKSFWVEFGDFRCRHLQECWAGLVWSLAAAESEPGLVAHLRSNLRQPCPCPLLPPPLSPLPPRSIFRLEEVVAARLVAGFARAGKVRRRSSRCSLHLPARRTARGLATTPTHPSRCAADYGGGVCGRRARHDLRLLRARGGCVALRPQPRRGALAPPCGCTPRAAPPPPR